MSQFDLEDPGRGRGLLDPGSGLGSEVDLAGRRPRPRPGKAFELPRPASILADKPSGFPPSPRPTFASKPEQAAPGLGTKVALPGKSEPALYHPPERPSRTTRRWSDRTNLQNNG